MADKTTDLAGPGIGNYTDLEKILPRDYASLLTPKDTQIAIAKVKRYIEDNLCKELNLIRVEVPLSTPRRAPAKKMEEMAAAGWALPIYATRRECCP